MAHITINHPLKDRIDALGQATYTLAESLEDIRSKMGNSKNPDCAEEILGYRLQFTPEELLEMARRLIPS